MTPHSIHSLEAHFFLKLTLGIVMISTATLSAALCDFVPISLNVEITLTANAVFIVLAGLRQFYLDIQHCYQKEQLLTQQLIDQLQHEPGEHPTHHVAWSVLKEQLEQEPNYVVRLETLSQYQKNAKARAKLLALMLEEQAEMEVLEMLGLRWHDSKNESDLKQQA